MVAVQVVILNFCRIFYYTGCIYGYKKNTRGDEIRLKYANYLFCEYAFTLYIVILKEPSPYNPSI